MVCDYRLLRKCDSPLSSLPAIFVNLWGNRLAARVSKSLLLLLQNVGLRIHARMLSAAVICVADYTSNAIEIVMGIVSRFKLFGELLRIVI